MKRLRIWTAGLSKGEIRGMAFSVAAALTLTVIGTALSYSTVADVGRCIEYHEYQRLAGSEEDGRQEVVTPPVGSNEEVGAQTDQRSGKSGEKADQNRFGCDTPDRSDEVAIGYAGLWMALYAFFIALLFSVIALLTFYVNFVESRVVSKPDDSEGKRSSRRHPRLQRAIRTAEGKP